ncbi:MAG: hypothetical protein ACR2PR_09130 [Pseudohongiellaceae bacterium]
MEGGNDIRTITQMRGKVDEVIQEKLIGSEGTKGKKAAATRMALEKRIAEMGFNQRTIEYENHHACQIDERFWDGTLTISDQAGRIAPALRDMQVNIIRPAGEYLKGALKVNSPEGYIEIAGQGGFAAAPGGEILMQIQNEFDARLVAAMAQSEFDLHRERAIDSAVVTGVGYVHVMVKPAFDGRRLRFAAESYDYKNVLADTGSRDMDDAEFVFLLKEMDLMTLKAHYPDAEKMRSDGMLLKNLSRDYVQTTSSLWEWNNFRSSNAQLFRRGGTTERPRIIFGIGYLRDVVRVNGIARKIYLQVVFAADSNFQNVMLLKDPVWMGAGKPPVCRLYYERNKATGLHYAPIVRDREKIARQITAMARNVLPTLASRGVRITDPSGQSDETLMNNIRSKISQTTFVIATPPGADIEVLDFKNDAKALMEGIKLFTTLAGNAGANIHPALLGGGDGTVEAASAFEGLRHDALSSISTFQRNLDRDVTEYASNHMLSMIEQYNGWIAPLARVANNKLITLGSDGDYLIENNSALFHVRAVKRDMVFGDKNHVQFMGMIAQRAETFTQALAFYAVMLRGSSIPDKMSMVNSLKSIIMQDPNVPLITDLFTEQELQQIKQMKQAHSQQQTQAMQMEMGDKQADIGVKHATAQELMARAQKPSDNAKIMELKQALGDIAAAFAEAQGVPIDTILSGFGKQQQQQPQPRGM